ncbi:hypothetical protein GGG16DRAFT_83996 [Schizophyllum commune]
MSVPGSPRSLSPTPSMNMLNRSLSRAPSNESLAPRHLSPACSGEHLPTQRSTDSLTGTLRRVSSWTSFILGRPISPSPSNSSVSSCPAPVPTPPRATLSRSVALYNMRPSSLGKQQRDAQEVAGPREVSLPSEKAQSTPTHGPPEALLSPTLASPAPRPPMPDSLSWLKDVSLQIVIDQEGFREAEPCFRFAGYSAQARSLDPDDPTSGGGAVQFMPVKRQAYHFHYAPLDGLPVVRRVMTNNGTPRDIISRQANLSLKATGVYTIHGCESATYHPSGASVDQLKLKWRFDYMVDDRRHDTTGRIMAGEKTLTPITFSCSPMLVHPMQGKKVGLMQVMKKSVATKLIAEKMEVPVMPGAARVVPAMSTPQTHKRTPSGPINFIKGGWMAHKRALSHGTKKISRGEEGTGSPRPEKENKASEMSSPIRRHRRGVSVPGTATIGMSSAKDKTMATPIHMPRHIIPRAQLAEIMNRRASVEVHTPQDGKRVRPSSVGITPLGPKPRRRAEPMHAA